ncbi:transposase [Halobacillus halophilus]|uniref:transposase n=1 Tax=Halobacillus halophilus TaxID=1570 RepID=UPI003C6D6B95
MRALKKSRIHWVTSRRVHIHKFKKSCRNVARQPEKVERSFADSKEQHGLRYFRLLGKEKGKEQALMTAA